MEVKMQTSFVPKKLNTESRPGGSAVSLFLLLSIILFVFAVGSAGYVYFRQKSLISTIQKDKLDLASDKLALGEDTISDLVRFNDRIEQSKILLSKHLAVSPIFTLLEKNVLKNVRLKTMKFSNDTGDNMIITLSGTALSYDVLSKQSDAFGTTTLRKFISNPVITDFSPTEDGSVSFNFTASINPALVSYKNIVPSSQ